MLAYLIVSCVSASFGFILGCALGASKVADLCDRLATAEEDLALQTAVLHELTSATRDVLSVVDGRLVHRVGPEAVSNLQEVLANCDGVASPRQERAGGDAG